jgi:hypothetical protein
MEAWNDLFSRYGIEIIGIVAYLLLLYRFHAWLSGGTRKMLHWLQHKWLNMTPEMRDRRFFELLSYSSALVLIAMMIYYMIKWFMG